MQALSCAFIAERKLLGGQPLGCLKSPWRPLHQQFDLGEAHAQQPGSETLLPRAEHRRDDHGALPMVRRAVPADQRQYISRPGGRSEPDPRGGQGGKRLRNSLLGQALI